MQWIDIILNNIIVQVGAIIAVLIGGITAIIGLFDRESRRRNKTIAQEGDDAEERVRSLYKEEIEQLSGKVDQLKLTSESQAEKIGDLEAKNEVIVSIFQGRDDDSKKFRKEGRAAIRVAEEASERIEEVSILMKQHNDEAIAFRKQHSQEIRELYKSINELLGSIDKKLN